MLSIQNHSCAKPVFTARNIVRPAKRHAAGVAKEMYEFLQNNAAKSKTISPKKAKNHKEFNEGIEKIRNIIDNARRK